ncbi:FecR family protein [Pontibacter silvestris]|uniref:FecR family protein n=1 Tax=Pontibacter silvestris TaxID=2305183 RepID=A0ABW4X3L9_9BACT|nr:FecR domain-containing protein [Pontibacter silvestris]MCC9134844.1 FecR domain-containing protein [Pontibacter silvestris]
MDYSKHGVADFAVDDFFIQWVKKPTKNANLFWIHWLEHNPDKYEVLQEARELVLILTKDEDNLSEWELNEMWQNLNMACAASTVQEVANKKVVTLRLWERKSMLAAAAVTLLLLISGITLFIIGQQKTVIYATHYGEKQSILLPDSSIVVLNANSQLTIPAADWGEEEPREVRLKGEAYFSITHKVNNQKFIVHTSDGVQVEVLGTEFNVSDRGSRNRVVLASGKVMLNIARTGVNKQLLMKPGELVEIAEDAGTITKQEIDTDIYTSWKDNKLIFYDISLQEIATMLEENYGYAVVIQDKALADQKITAFLDAGSLSDILVTLSETLGVKIIQDKQKRIMISND